MEEWKELKLFIFISIYSYFLIEGFFNFVLYANTVFLVNYINSLGLAIPWVIFCLGIISLELFFFSLEKYNQYKMLILACMVIIFRLLMLLYFTVILFLLFCTAFFISFVIGFSEIFLNFKFSEYYQEFIAGFIVGFNIQALFLIVNVSSNLSTDFLKFPATLIIGIILFFISINSVKEKLFELQEGSKK
ncbi:MAG: hypothetical protein ACTSR8_14405 [Promethearchaeota archaeon]